LPSYDIILLRANSLSKVLVALESTSRGKFWIVSDKECLDRPYEVGIVVVTATILLLE